MPTRSQTHIDRGLTNMSVAYIQEASEFIADKIFPVLPTKTKTNVYFKYDKGDFFRNEMRERSRYSESVGGDYDISTESPYSCRLYSFHTYVGDMDRANADDPIDPDEDATDFVTQKMLIQKDVKWATDYFQTGKWTTEKTGVSASPSTNQFLQFDQPLSDPITYMNELLVEIAENTGFKFNTCVMSPWVFYALKNHDAIIERFVYTQKGVITQDMIRGLLEVENLYVPWGVYNAATKGAADDIGFIYGKHIWFGYVPKKPGIKKPSAGYTFAWQGLMGAGALGGRIARLDASDKGLGTEKIECDVAYAHLQTGQDLGVFLKDAIG